MTHENLLTKYALFQQNPEGVQPDAKEAITLENCRLIGESLNNLHLATRNKYEGLSNMAFNRDIFDRHHFGESNHTDREYQLTPMAFRDVDPNEVIETFGVLAVEQNLIEVNHTGVNSGDPIDHLTAIIGDFDNRVANKKGRQIVTLSQEIELVVNYDEKSTRLSLRFTESEFEKRKKSHAISQATEDISERVQKPDQMLQNHKAKIVSGQNEGSCPTGEVLTYVEKLNKRQLEAIMKNMGWKKVGNKDLKEIITSAFRVTTNSNKNDLVVFRPADNSEDIILVAERTRDNKMGIRFRTHVLESTVADTKEAAVKKEALLNRAKEIATQRFTDELSSGESTVLSPRVLLSEAKPETPLNYPLLDSLVPILYTHLRDLANRTGRIKLAGVIENQLKAYKHGTGETEMETEIVISNIDSGEKWIIQTDSLTSGKGLVPEIKIIRIGLHPQGKIIYQA